MDEAERRFLDETAAATRAYNSQMMSLSARRDAETMQVNTMHRELLQTKAEMIQKYGWFDPSRLSAADQAEHEEMAEQIRRIEQDHRRATAPVKEAYAKAIEPAQRRLQEARARKQMGGAKSPSELARQRR